jgi:hypothetical protein
MLLITDRRYWHSDWNQFLPDAVAALVTGATVGLVVLSFQRGIERRAEERAQALRWSATRELLARATAGAEDVMFFPTSAEVVGFDHQRILDVTNGAPIQTWRDTMTDKSLQYLVVYLDCLNAAQKSGHLLDAALNSTMGSLSKDLIEPHRRAQIRKSVLDWIDVCGNRGWESVDVLDEAAVATLLGEPNINHAGQAWRVDVAALAYAYADLADSLNPGEFEVGYLFGDA